MQFIANLHTQPLFFVLNPMSLSVKCLSVWVQGGLSPPESRKAEVENAIAQIQQLVSEGYKPQDIAVIYRYLGRCEAASFNLLTQQLDELGLGCYWVNQDKKNYSSRHPGVRLITTKSALGLEFKAVIIPWVQQFGVGDENEAKRELYVSMTRAQDILCLFGSGRFPVLQELEECDRFDIAS